MMKKTIAFLLAAIMILGALPISAIYVFAAEATKAVSAPAEEAKTETLSPGEAVEKAMSQRKAITKDRSQIASTSQAAVYVDDELVAEGDFSAMWNAAMSRAPEVKSDYSKFQIEGLPTVEFVLNKDFRYDKSWFKEKTMTVSGKKLTIDLNGCMLVRTDNDGSVIRVKNHAVLTIMDSNTRNSTHIGAMKDHRWNCSEGTSKPLSGGIITGGYYKTGDGGGLHISGDSTVYLTGGTIAGNKADVGSAVYIEGHSTLDMSKGNSQICYNYCAGTTTDGGAIFMRSNATVIGGYVHHNLADDYGGGIRIKGGNITVKDVTIYANKAEEYGGGLYIERSKTLQVSTVSGCTVVGNYAGKRGGGAYIYDIYMINMDNCTVENNASDEHGGGICLSDYGSELVISGKMIVRNNYKSSQKNMANATDNSNLYIQGNDDLIVGSLSALAEVWVRTGKNASKYNGSEKPIAKSTSGSTGTAFYSDNTKYYVEYQKDPAKDHYRCLYLVEGTKPQKLFDLTQEDLKPVVLSQHYKVKAGPLAGSEFPLYRGYFEYNLMSSEDFYSASPFYYSDGYFFDDPEKYNFQLATMSINMAVAAFGRYTDDIEGNRYANHFANVKQLMADIGCDDSKFFVNDGYQNQPAYYGTDDKLSTIGVAMSQKDVVVSGDTYTIIPVAIRGGSYEVEWASNVTLGASGEAKGFADAANQVYGYIQDYLRNYDLEEQAYAGKVKFWVVGYSRAGATANLTSKRLVDTYAQMGNQVFGYTFEAPMGGVESAKLIAEHTKQGTYPTIHNTINENDFVTLVAPFQMGFLRYGTDQLIGANFQKKDPVSYEKNSKYYKQRMKMIAQLSAINPYYQFNDSWQVADVNIILGNLPIFATDVIDKGKQIWDDPNPECKNIYEFLRWFFFRVQMDGLDVPNAADKQNEVNTDFRDYYSQKTAMSKIYPSTADEVRKKLQNKGVPQSVCNFIWALFTNSPRAKEELLHSDLSIEESVAFLMNVVFTLPEKESAELIDLVMNSLNKFLDESSTFALLRIYLMFEAWEGESIGDRQDTLFVIMHILLDDIMDDLKRILGEEKTDTLRQALSTVLYFVLNYASADYADTADDDGMWGVGTFINNMDVIVANHYQEISVAWVRSYDEYYAKELTAYKVGKITSAKPKDVYVSANNVLKISAQEGSTIFYSVDDGKTWSLYTQPLDASKIPEKIKCFAVYHGANSGIETLYKNNWTGTLLGNGNVWFVLAGSTVIVVATVLVLESGRKKKRAKAA